MTAGDTIQEIQAYIAQGDWPRAEQMLERLLAQAPSAEGFKNLALIRLQVGRYEAALHACALASQRAPDDPQLIGLRGDILHRAGRYREALHCYRESVARSPTFTQGWVNLATVLTQVGSAAEAVLAWEAVAALCPKDPSPLRHLGALLSNLDRHQEATTCLRSAVQLAPDDGDSFGALGAALIRSADPTAALEALDRARSLQPDRASHGYHIGLAHAALGDDQQAMSAYRSAIALDAAHLDSRWNLSLLLLRHDQWTEGWPLFESRLERPTHRAPSAAVSCIPRWDGRAASRGERLLVIAEQGLGDTLMFCRFAKAAAERGFAVDVLAQPPLRALLRRAPGIDQVLEENQWQPSDYCARIELLSLPFILGVSPRSVPFRDTPYLTANAEQVGQLRETLRPENRLKVGLCWRGQKNLSLMERSISLAMLRDALPNELAYFSLQKNLLPDERPIAKHLGMQFDETRDLDFEATAALASVMDLIVTIDTSIAHLVAALGKQTAVIVPHDADWRWGHERPSNHWYSGVRVIRGSRISGWQHALRKLNTFFRG